MEAGVDVGREMSEEEEGEKDDDEEDEEDCEALSEDKEFVGELVNPPRMESTGMERKLPPVGCPAAAVPLAETELLATFLGVVF